MANPSSPDQPDASTKRFLSRWSRQKSIANKGRGEAAESHTTAHEPDFVAVQPQHVLRDAPSDEVAAHQPDSELGSENPEKGAVVSAENGDANTALESQPRLTDADMPSLSTLTANSDVSLFFNEGVSEALRQAALRTIFSQPQYNVRDHLDDYDEDYTYFEPLGDIETCDMKFHVARKEASQNASLESQESAELPSASAEQSAESALLEDDPNKPSELEAGITNDPEAPEQAKALEQVEHPSSGDAALPDVDPNDENSLTTEGVNVTVNEHELNTEPRS